MTSAALSTSTPLPPSSCPACVASEVVPLQAMAQRLLAHLEG